MRATVVARVRKLYGGVKEQFCTVSAAARTQRRVRLNGQN